MSAGGSGVLRIQLLGPVRAWRGDQELVLGAARQLAVLGMLAVRANQAVSRDEFVDGIWGPEPPVSAVNSVHIYIAELRRILEPDRALREPGRVIIGAAQGYMLLIDPDQVDALVFEGHLDRARLARAAGDLAAAARSLDAALGLSQAAPLPQIRGPWADIERTRLGELRLTAVEERTDILLAQGRPGEAVTELAGLVREHPLRERFRAQLMLGLYRCGRQAEALATYADARRILIEELGIEPGSALRGLHAQILAGDPALSPAVAIAAKPVPRELPADIDAFTGRKEELAVLDRLLSAEMSSAPGISVVSGTAGVGKTALAVRWAHRVRDAFPDGQLYVDLRGYDPGRPVSADDAVARLLRSLGVTDREMPADLEERSARYRSLLTGQRVLVLLDNAATADQVWPLLPGSASCAVLVTSRDSLAGLVARHGARRLDLRLFPVGDAIDLLGALIGDRVGADPDAAAALARNCALLPLALRVAAEFAAAHPAMTMAGLAGELADEQRRLSVLDAGGDSRTAVRSVFSWSYRHLPAAAARAFRLLGLHPGTDIDPHATAALIATSSQQASHILEQLTRANLIHATAPARYGMHDLLRAYARDVAGHDARGENRDALTRLFDHYLGTTAAAINALFPTQRPRAGTPVPVPVPAAGPEVKDPASARAWLDAERASLVAVTAYCAASGWPGHATRMAATVWRYLDDGHYSDAIIVHSNARLAARQLGDRATEADALSSLGVVAWHLSRYEQAIEYQQRALALFRDTGDTAGQARALGNLGSVNSQHGHYQEADGYHQQSLALYRQVRDREGEAGTLTNLGILNYRQGNYEQCAGYHQQALALFRDLGDREGEARVLNNLSTAHLELGRYPEAVDCLERALVLVRELGVVIGEAHVLCNLGCTRARQDRHEESADLHRQSLALYREAGYQVGEVEALDGLGEALAASGRVHEARRLLQEALDRRIALGLPEAERFRARLAELDG